MKVAMTTPTSTNNDVMKDLGQFSISLAVKDIAASRAFYEKLGFTIYDGKQKDNWLILKNGDIVIGLFQGMFEGNILTFHPSDVRGVQAHLQASGVELIETAKEGDGPAHITMVDPDGNAILMDQFAEDYTPAPDA